MRDGFQLATASGAAAGGSWPAGEGAPAVFSGNDGADILAVFGWRGPRTPHLAASYAHPLQHTPSSSP